MTELLVATAIAGVAIAVMATTLTNQQRFYRSASAVTGVRSQLRDAADVLVTDIRGAAVSTMGVPLMSDTAIELFTTIATSVGCTPPSGTTIGLPPARLSSGTTLTSILSPPDTGDLALILAIPGGMPDSARWESYRISSFSSRALSTSCPASTGFTVAGDNYSGATGYMLTLASSPSAGVRRGAPIHFVRRVRYSLYRSSDGEWYLGYRRCSATGTVSCATIQPVSGPYTAYKGSATTAGISFRYYDGTGAPIVRADQSLARVDIVLRGETAGEVALAGDMRSRWRDSVIVTVSPRNRAR